ncbi:MAG: hypothetical protein IJ642_13415 [Oscillospiraceae bacterium]|nr:hypothetical protein [Oscillospiraceae bacterium]
MKKEREHTETTEQPVNENLVFRKPGARHELESSRTTVSFIESGSPSRDSGKNDNPSGTASSEPVYDTSSKIRRMSDSTRAREAQRNRRHQKTEENYTYEKERPDGEYAYTEIHDAKKYNKNKKKKRFSRPDDVTAMASETLQLDLRDIVPVAVPQQEPVKPVDVSPAPRAQRTSMNLSASERSTLTADSLDVTIRRTPEEAAAETRRRQHISDMMKLEKTADIRTDIQELRSAVAFRAGGLMLAAVVSMYLSLRYAFDFPWLNSIPENLICLMQLLLGFASASVCVPALKNGLSRLVQFRADTDTPAAIAWLACMLDSFFGIFGMQHNGLASHFMPCAIFILLLHTIGKLFIIDREENNLKTASDRFDCYGLHIIDDEAHAESLARGAVDDFPVTAAMRKTDSLKDFRKYTYSADLADQFCRYAAPASCAFSLLAALILALVTGGGIGYALGLFSMFAVASGCAAITFVVNLPLFKASKKLTSHGALLLGYQSVDDFYDTNSIMIDASSLFPEGSVQLRGVKMYSNVKTEETLLAAASLSRYAGSAFSRVFNEVLHGKEQMLYPIENFVYEDTLGLCGWIHNQRILLGTREMMLSHRIEGIPSKTKEAELTGDDREAVYLSISGNLSALFVIELQSDKNVNFWVQQAVKRNLSLIIHSVDPIITKEKLSDLFDIPAEMVKIIPAKMSEIYRAETAPVKEMSASMACTNSFSNIMRLIACSKVVKNAATAGIFLQAVGILIGLVLVVMESLLHVGVTPAWMLILQCAVSLVTVLCVNIRRLF